MPRRVVEVTIERAGRDHGKRFQLTEMPASQAEEWAMRAFLALSASGVEVPDDVARHGLAGLSTLGVGALGRMPWELAKPLLEEMMRCVKSVQRGATRPLIEDDIEEVATRLELRKEVVRLHFDFFPEGAPSTSDPPTPSPAPASS